LETWLLQVSKDFNFFLYFSDCFNVMILKINFKKLKKYFDIFLNKKYFKKYYHNTKHHLNQHLTNDFFLSNMKFIANIFIK
jgi:hypothetical protein